MIHSPTSEKHHQYKETITQRTSNFMKSITEIEARQLNPEKLLLFLINIQHKEIECEQEKEQQLEQEQQEQSLTKQHQHPSSKHKITTLTKEITQLREKIHNKLLSNKTVIELVKKRDDLALRLELLLKERNNNELKLTITEQKQKYNFLSLSSNSKYSKQFMHSLSLNKESLQYKKDNKNNKNNINNNFKVIRQNLRYYKANNIEIEQKMRELTIKCGELERKNRMLIEQQEIKERVNSMSTLQPSLLNINRESLEQEEQERYRYKDVNSNIKNIKNINNKISNINNNISSSSELWLNKIESIKQKYLVNDSNKNNNNHNCDERLNLFTEREKCFCCYQNNQSKCINNCKCNCSLLLNKTERLLLTSSPSSQSKLTFKENKLSRVKSLKSTRIS